MNGFQEPKIPKNVQTVNGEIGMNNNSVLGIGIVLIVFSLSMVSLSLLQSYSDLKLYQSSIDGVDEFGRGFGQDEPNRYIFAKDCHEKGGEIVVDYKAATMECVV